MLKAIQTQHREIARLKFAGRKPVEIATMTGFAISTVRGILADPLCKAYIAQLNDVADAEIIDVRKRMIKMNHMALDRLEDILDPNSDNIPYPVIAKVAMDNLDRTGHQVVQRHQHMSVHLTKDDLAALKQRAIDAGASIPEAEYKEV